MYKICSNIKCFECQDIAAQSGEKCSDCNSILVEATAEVEATLAKLSAMKVMMQGTLNKMIMQEIGKKQNEWVAEINKTVEEPIVAEPSMQDQINNLDQSVSFNKWKERKIK